MKPMFIALASLCGLLACGQVVAAGVGLTFFPDGRSVDTSYNVPLVPTDPKECVALSLRIAAVKKRISDAHSECLKSYPGGGVSTYIGKDACSSSSCQGLHTAGAEISARDEVSACYRRVDEARSSASAMATRPNFSHDIRAIAAGPISALRSWVKDKLAGAISDAFGTYGVGEQAGKTGFGAQTGVPIVSPKDVKAALGVAETTAKLYSTVVALQKACRSEGESIAAVCQDESRRAIESLSMRVPARARTDPAVGLIQAAMLQRLSSIERQTMDSLTDVLAKAGDGEFKVLDREQFPNQQPAGPAAVEVNDHRAAESQVLIESRRNTERRMVDQAEQRHREDMARAEQRAQEKQQSEIQRQLLEAMTGGGSSGRSEARDKNKGTECWSPETVCSSNDSKCISEQRAQRARMPRCKGR